MNYREDVSARAEEAELDFYHHLVGSDQAGQAEGLGPCGIGVGTHVRPASSASPAWPGGQIPTNWVF